MNYVNISFKMKAQIQRQAFHVMIIYKNRIINQNANFTE